MQQPAFPAAAEEESPGAAPAPCGQDPTCESPCCHSPLGYHSWMSTGFLQPICPNVNVTMNERATYAPPVDGAYVPMRVGLINAKCRYYDTPGGCQNPFCRFLHEETPYESPVFHDGSETLTQRSITAEKVAAMYELPKWAPPMMEVVDARVFFGNCPATNAEERIRELVEPFGEITKLDIIPSNLHNRRVSGFIHMTSLEAAEAAIEKLNDTVLGRRAKLYANLKSCRTILRPAPVEVEADDTLCVGSLPTLIEIDDEDAASFGDGDSPVSVMASSVASSPPEFGLDKDA